MVDAYRRRSPLDHLGLGARARNDAGLSGTGVVMSEVPHRGLVNLRGDAADPAFIAAVEKALKLAPPTKPNTVAGKPQSTRLFWLGPDEWLAVTRPGGQARVADGLRKALNSAKLHFAVNDTSEARTTIRISGPSARRVLAKGCALDLHPSAFATGQCAQTVIAKIGVILTQSAGKSDTPTYEMMALRSYSTFLWTWLEDAADEFGLKVE